MHKPERPDPEAVLAHVRLLRLTDALLDVADQLRTARDAFQDLLESRPSKAGEGRRLEVVGHD